MASNAEEEAIIHKRYLTQTTSISVNLLPPFKALVKRYMDFIVVLEGGRGGGLEEAQRVHFELLGHLYAIQLHGARLEAQRGAFAQEQASYVQKQEQLQASIQQAERDIEARQQQLGEARAELARRQEYEVLRKQVMQVPSRAATLAEQEAAQREIADLQQQSADLDALFARRQAQFAEVLDALEALQQTIERETPGEDGGGGGGAAAASAAPQHAAASMQVG